MDSEAFKNYEKLLKNAKQELYPGCENFSVLTSMVELMHGKIKFRLSYKCFDYFLGVIKRMLPKENFLILFTNIIKFLTIILLFFIFVGLL